MKSTVLVTLLLHLPQQAAAFEAVRTRDAFVSLVDGRILSGDGVSLSVDTGGTILGRAFGLRVTGTWDWENAMFCRTLDTILRDFPRNCQTVQVQGTTLRFTADRGRGDVADLTLR